MMGRRTFGLFGLSALLAGCGGNSDTFGRSFDYRYKLTAEVETSAGVKSGSSVFQIGVGMSGKIMPPGMRGGSAHVLHGEAVAVDVAPGEAMFVLMRSANSVDWATDAATSAFTADNPQWAGPGSDVEAYYAALKADRAVHVLWGDTVPRDRAQYLPLMVRFKNPADPKSVEQVAPDNLAKSFGPGYRLKSLTVQLTDDPVTVGIEKRLPKEFWLKWDVIAGNELSKGDVNSNPYYDSMIGRLDRNDFILGSSK